MSRGILFLVSKYLTTEKGGIQTKEDSRKFISDLEEILGYLKKMGYENEVAKELAHDKKLQQTKDGKGFIPKLDKLKDYMEASLSILALGVSTMGATTKIETNSAERRKIQNQWKVKVLENSPNFKRIINLYTELNTSHNTQALPPHFTLPRQPAAGTHWRRIVPKATDYVLLLSTNNSDAHYFLDFDQRMGDGLGKKGKEKEKAEESVPENMRKSTGNSPKAPPPNQEAN
ncbi:uncharacterized protein VP01_437g3 [Puccinia sorghi]|uniref:Uncharacterized protein n=1 Tax=Puccinia sorghi TaxID=27349 RepID=A0A0L6UQK0_9BASI|nr:uncharacterized protein VP01_437g3 [Puccinia sorghi]